MVEQLLKLSRTTRYLSENSGGSHLRPQQLRPVVEQLLKLSSTTSYFSENSVGSHLRLQQHRPVVERCGHLRVIRAQHLLQDFRGPNIQRAGLVQFSLKYEQPMRHDWVGLWQAEVQMLNNPALLLSHVARSGWSRSSLFSPISMAPR